MFTEDPRTQLPLHIAMLLGFAEQEGCYCDVSQEIGLSMRWIRVCIQSPPKSVTMLTRKMPEFQEFRDPRWKLHWLGAIFNATEKCSRK